MKMGDRVVVSNPNLRTNGEVGKVVDKWCNMVDVKIPDRGVFTYKEDNLKLDRNYKANSNGGKFLVTLVTCDDPYTELSDDDVRMWATDEGDDEAILFYGDKEEIESRVSDLLHEFAQVVIVYNQQVIYTKTSVDWPEKL